MAMRVRTEAPQGIVVLLLTSTTTSAEIAKLVERKLLEAVRLRSADAATIHPKVFRTIERFGVLLSMSKDMPEKTKQRLRSTYPRLRDVTK